MGLYNPTFISKCQFSWPFPLPSLYREVREFKLLELPNITDLSDRDSEDKLPTAIFDTLFKILADTAFFLKLNSI